MPGPHSQAVSVAPLGQGVCFHALSIAALDTSYCLLIFLPLGLLHLCMLLTKPL